MGAHSLDVATALDNWAGMLARQVKNILRRTFIFNGSFWPKSNFVLAVYPPVRPHCKLDEAPATRAIFSVNEGLPP